MQNKRGQARISLRQAPQAAEEAKKKEKELMEVRLLLRCEVLIDACTCLFSVKASKVALQEQKEKAVETLRPAQTKFLECRRTHGCPDSEACIITALSPHGGYILQTVRKSSEVSVRKWRAARNGKHMYFPHDALSCRCVGTTASNCLSTISASDLAAQLMLAKVKLAEDACMKALHGGIMRQQHCGLEMAVREKESAAGNCLSTSSASDLAAQLMLAKVKLAEDACMKALHGGIMRQQHCGLEIAAREKESAAGNCLSTSSASDLAAQLMLAKVKLAEDACMKALHGGIMRQQHCRLEIVVREKESAAGNCLSTSSASDLAAQLMLAKVKLAEDACMKALHGGIMRQQHCGLEIAAREKESAAGNCLSTSSASDLAAQLMLAKVKLAEDACMKALHGGIMRQQHCGLEIAAREKESAAGNCLSTSSASDLAAQLMLAKVKLAEDACMKLFMEV